MKKKRMKIFDCEATKFLPYWRWTSLELVVKDQCRQMLVQWMNIDTEFMRDFMQYEIITGRYSSWSYLRVDYLDNTVLLPEKAREKFDFCSLISISHHLLEEYLTFVKVIFPSLLENMHKLVIEHYVVVVHRLYSRK